MVSISVSAWIRWAASSESSSSVTRKTESSFCAASGVSSRRVTREAIGSSEICVACIKLLVIAVRKQRRIGNRRSRDILAPAYLQRPSDAEFKYRYED